MKIRSSVKRSRLALLWLCLAPLAGSLACARVSAGSAADPLPSWKDGPARRAILDLVKATTDRATSGFVPPEDRIATFDQDGTLWVEHPRWPVVSMKNDWKQIFAFEGAASRP
jgi:hypothetical protein